MKATASFQVGDVVCPLPQVFTVKEDKLLLPNGETVLHGTDYNVTIISHFLIAVSPLQADDEIRLNFNLAFYDMLKSCDDNTFTNPVVPGFRYLTEEEKQSLYLFADECVRQQAVADGFVPRGKEGGIAVVRTKRDTLVAVSSREQAAGAVVFESTGVLLPFPVRSTTEVPGDMHLRLTGGSEFVRHSCLPNLRLEVNGAQIRGIALRPIEKGEKLSFNYLCTEWEVSKVFYCSCNVYCCYGLIKGFKYLDREQQEHLLPHCSAAVQEKYRAPLLESGNLTAMHAKAALCTAATGRIVSQHDIPAGTVLFQVEQAPRVEGDELVLENVRLPHSCDANTVLLDGRLVTARPLSSGEPLTCNLCLLHYELPTSFTCHCGCCADDTVRGFGSLAESEKTRLWIYATPEVRATALKHNYHIPSASRYVEVRASESMGQATYAASNIPVGARVFHVKGLVIPFPTVYTIYLGEGKHLLFADGAQCLAHSCQPNTQIVVNPVTGSLDCFAAENISQGSLVSFNYLTTEWDMDEPFSCACGSPRCYGTIAGFAHLKRGDQLHLWRYATKAVRALFAQRSAAVGSILATLNSERVAPYGAHGELCVVQDLPSGTVLFDSPQGFQVDGNRLFFGDVRIPHSCDPSAVFLENHVVLRQAVNALTPVTVNLNQLVYKLPEPYVCNCQAACCVGTIAGFGGLTYEEQCAQLLCTLPEVRAEAIAYGFKNPSRCPLVDVRANGEMGQATFAAKPIPAGTRFFKVTGLVLPFPTVYTILIEPGRHLLFADGAQCLAHSCEPNVRVMVDAESRSLDCLALRDIAEGEVISFNYLATEWDMSTPFKCVCGSPHCYGRISGFKHLTAPQRQVLWSTATPAIRLLAQTSENWKQLASPQLTTDGAGHVRAARELAEGTPILTATRVTLHENTLLADEICLHHSCEPTAALVEHRIVLLETIRAGAEITVDLTCLAYHLEKPFTCHCRAHSEPHEVGGFATLSPASRASRLIFTDAAVRVAALQDGYKVPCTSALVTVRANGDMGQATFAAAPIRAGTHFLHVKGVSLPFPTIYTIMLSSRRHLLFADGAQCLAHSCDPNVQICVDAVNSVLDCEALRDIAEGELISFNYNTTEWDMNTPFKCLCGSANCVYDIRGFKHLTRAQQEALLPRATPAIKELAVANAEVQLPPHLLSADGEGFLHAVAAIPVERVLLELSLLEPEPTQVRIGRYIIRHSEDSNCVLVEGRIVSCKALRPGESLTVNMNYFIYDMTVQFPNAYTATCKGFKHMDEALKQRYLYLCEPNVRAQAMRDGWIVKSTQDALVVRPNGDMGQTAYATRDIPVGTTLFHCTGLVVPFPTMYTICVGEGRHLLFGDAAECIAHHCDPNVRVTVNGDDSFDFITIKPIAKGEMVTFNYASTEWDMNTPFVCLCGSPACARTMQGFKYLSDVDRQRLWPITSDVVKRHCE